MTSFAPPCGVLQARRRIARLVDEPAPAIDAQGIRPPAAYAIEDGRATGAAAVLVLRGELDMAAAAELRARLDAPTVVLALVVDLTGVTFIDSAVLKELLRAREQLAGRGVRLVLAGASHPVQRLLDLTHTSGLFEHAPDAAGALARF
jgi:anti-sigma B factor antagonist